MSFEQVKKFTLQNEGITPRVQLYEHIDELLTLSMVKLELEGEWAPVSISLDFGQALFPQSELILTARLKRRTSQLLFWSVDISLEGEVFMTSQAIWGKV